MGRSSLERLETDQKSAVNICNIMYWPVCSPVELKDQVMLRLKLLEALMETSRFLLAWKEPNSTAVASPYAFSAPSSTTADVHVEPEQPRRFASSRVGECTAVTSILPAREAAELKNSTF